MTVTPAVAVRVRRTRMLVYDLGTRRRVHPATVWGGLVLVASQPLRLMISGTAAWTAFAAYATGW